MKSKIDEYVFFRDTHNQYNRRHVFHLESGKSLPDYWNHKIHSDGEDDEHNLHYFWIKLQDAKGRLSGQLNYSIDELQKILKTNNQSV